MTVGRSKAVVAWSVPMHRHWSGWCLFTFNSALLESHTILGQPDLILLFCHYFWIRPHCDGSGEGIAGGYRLADFRHERSHDEHGRHGESDVGHEIDDHSGLSGPELSFRAFSGIRQHADRQPSGHHPERV